tara:strand:- start:1140 stop:1721 length:582 start_codon:yes stop_codon:yes gene_type:complete
MSNGQGGNMTTNQIIDLLATDFDFGINFIIDNNPQAVESNISALSIPLPENPSNLQLREVIDTLLQDGSDEMAPEKVEQIVMVPYIDTQTNYTGQLGQEIAQLMPPAEDGSAQSSGVWVALTNTIVQGISNIWGGYQSLQAQELQNQMLEDQYHFELQQLEKTKILGIPQAVFIAVIIFLMFAMLIVYLSNRK